MPHDQAYLRAENKIEQALKSGATDLDLSAKQNAPVQERLSELPESLRSLTQLKSLSLRNNSLTTLPEWLGELTQLQYLNLSDNKLTTLPESIGNLKQLNDLAFQDNLLLRLPESIGQLIHLSGLNLNNNRLSVLPESLRHLQQLKWLFLNRNLGIVLPDWIGDLELLAFLALGGNNLIELPSTWNRLHNIQNLYVWGNPFREIPTWLYDLEKLNLLNLGATNLTELPERISDFPNLSSLILYQNSLVDIPQSLINLKHLDYLNLDENPLNSELAAAYKDGLDSVKTYLLLKSIPNKVAVYEAKLILIGEGEVGKTCLMDALLGKEWQEHPSTHGIEIQSFNVADSETKTKITLNGWDFGGQRVYRPTHQLFFSAPAVYLVVWKPREGPQQGFVKEWIRLIKHREPSAKILVVATHGGPQQRQPDIDRQELWDLFGKETVVDFFFVDSKPDANGHRKGIEELKRAIARVAAELPEVGRSVPKSFADVRAALKARNVPYLPLDEVLAICRAHNMDDEIARLFLTISHRLGHLTHYQHDPALRDIVILRPDWLAAAMSYVLDDEETRKSHGLVKLSHLNHLWDDPTRSADSRYEKNLHEIFARLMDRFDLSYLVTDPTPRGVSDPQRLIAQLVPDNRPENFVTSWLDSPSTGDLQQTQICRIVDDKGNTATAEGLFYQLIVRLHKYSLGRAHYADSVHWQRGLVLDDDYNGRALLEHKSNDVHITVRAPYPERFLAMLTEEVRYLVDSFWEGLRCEVTVPCLNPIPCIGLFEVSKLMDNLKRRRPEQPCPVCNEWQSIEQLLHNAPAATPQISIDVLMKEFAQVKGTLNEVNDNTRRILSQVDKNYTDLLQVLTDEAKEGPRLFSLFPLERSKFNPQSWIREKFRLVLWCEHSRLPLPVLNNGDMKKGVYDLDLDREWFKKASPYLKFLSGTLSMVLPVASSAVKLALDKPSYEAIEEQLNFGKSIIDASLGEATKLGEFIGAADSTNLEHGVAIRSDGATLRELHSLLKARDNSFGGLVRVMNKRQEFLWVHEQFAGEY